MRNFVPVAPEQRYTKTRPCPICGHYATDPNGHCHGLLSRDGEFARCTRADGTDGAIHDTHTAPETYVYRRTERGEWRPWMESSPIPFLPRRKPHTVSHAASTLPITEPSEKTHERREGYTLYDYGPDQRVRRHDYRDEHGAWAKACIPQHRKARGEWMDGYPETPARVYRRGDINDHLGKTICLLEGENCADETRKVLRYPAITWAGGTGQLAQAIPQLVDALAGTDVVLISDADMKGRAAMEKIAVALSGNVTRLRILDLYPAENPKDGGRDIQDWFAEGGTPAQFDALLAAVPDYILPETTEDEPGNLPQIDAGDLDLPRVTAAAWEALQVKNEPPYLFRYGGLPARLKQDDTKRPALQVLSEAGLRHVLARVADWYEVRKTGPRPALPPLHVVRDMLAEPNKPLPILTSIVEAPTFAPDGTLHNTPGYHAVAQSLYAPAIGFSVSHVPPKPTAHDIARARTLILDHLIGDFPFTGDAERAHAVALFLLPFVRRLIDGPTPLHLIEKPTAGTGASLLVDALTYAAIGDSPGVMTEGRDEDEWRKRITARLRGGDRVMLIDNLRRQLDSASLAAAITGRVWKDRLLGTSDDLAIPIQCGWVATANNAALSSEMTRRTVRVRLDAKTDRPWLGREFRHPNLLAWCSDHRDELAWAALVLGQAWLAEGRPTPDNAPVLGMFESWSRVMGGIFAVAGIPGFLGNLSEFYDASDTEGADIRAFLTAWWERYEQEKVTPADLYVIATAQDSTLDISAKSEQGQRVRLGKLLKTWKDRHYQLDSGLTVCVTPAGQSKRATLWRLEQKLGESRIADSSDSPSHLPSNYGGKSTKLHIEGESGEFFPYGPQVKNKSQTYYSTSSRDLGGKNSLDSPPHGNSRAFTPSESGIIPGESPTPDSPQDGTTSEGWEQDV